MMPIRQCDPICNRAHNLNDFDVDARGRRLLQFCSGQSPTDYHQQGRMPKTAF